MAEEAIAPVAARVFDNNRSALPRDLRRAMSPTEHSMDFRIPGPVVRRTFLQHASIVVVALAILQIASGHSSLSPMLGAGVLALSVLALAYAVTARRVWVTLSPTGLESTGLTGRRLELPWSTAVRTKRVRRSGYAGYAIVPVRYSNFVAASAQAIFVPLVVCKDRAFATAIASWSPPDHPLRDVVGDQATAR